MGRRDPRFTYEEYDAVLYMVGYSTMKGYESDPRLIQMDGLAIIQSRVIPPFDRIGRFVPKAWMSLYNTGNVIENHDYYGIGMFIGPYPDTPTYNRVWVTEGYPSAKAIKKIMDSLEDYMLDGYTPQEVLEDQIKLYGSMP